ncbi:MAG TPA: SPW repeat protein [Nitrolancea sp.]|nr:SPW repeat protein [Nitrolancea sp.]
MTRMNRMQQVVTTSGLTILAGLWLILSPFILGFTNLRSSMWNAIIVGIILAALAAIRLYSARRKSWISWVSAALGVWLILTPFFYQVTDNSRVMWNFIIVGIVVTVLGIWGALATEMGRTTSTEF